MVERNDSLSCSQADITLSLCTNDSQSDFDGNNISLSLTDDSDFSLPAVDDFSGSIQHHSLAQENWQPFIHTTDDVANVTLPLDDDELSQGSYCAQDLADSLVEKPPSSKHDNTGGSSSKPSQTAVLRQKSKRASSRVMVSPLQSSTPKKSRLDATREHEAPTATTSHSSSSLQSSTEKHPNWQLTTILEMTGCAELCATKVHNLTEFDILRAHHYFDNKTLKEQNQWIIEYFTSHCPSSATGENDVKSITYVIQGRSVCMKVWLEVLSVSSSRFYRLRHDYAEYGGIGCDITNTRSVSSKTLEATAWMEQYFHRIGDKCPDKGDAIILPTCLTEKKIYEIMIDELCHGDTTKVICYAQFNRIYRKEFKNVSIPKVRTL